MRGDKLRRLRRECNFSLRLFSEISGVSESEILNLESKLTHNEEEEKKAYILYKVLFEHKINMEKNQKFKEMENIIYQEAKEYKRKNIKKIKISILLTIVLSILAIVITITLKEKNIPNEKIKEDRIKIEQLGIIQKQLEKLKLDTQTPSNNQALNQLNILQEELKSFKFNIEKDNSYMEKSVNIYQLNAYNDQTKLQANKSFIVAIIISIIGFIILCLGLYFSYKEKMTSGFLTTGVGLIIEFISGTIFYLYNKTIIKMGEYHKKLVLTQNISLALKASEDLELKDRTKVKIKIVELLLQDINRYLSEK